MSNVAEHLKDILIKFRWIVIGIVIYFYGILLKNEIFSNASKDGLMINSWDVSLYLLNDIYIIVYFIVPIVLFISATIVLSDFNYMTLIRLGTTKKWVFRSLRRFWSKTSILLLILVFMSFYLTIGVPFSWDWSQYSKSNISHDTLGEIGLVFTAPFVAFLFQLGLLVLAISILHIFLSLFYVTIKKRNIFLIMCAILFLGSVVGFKLFPEEYAFLSPTTYFTLKNFIDSFNYPLIGLVVLIGLFIIFYLYILLLDINKRHYFQSIKSYLPHGIYLILCLTGIVSISISADPSKDTILDVLVLSFQGSNSESFSYFSFFYYSIVFFGLTYLINLDISREIEQIGYYKIIRYRNLEKWFWSWFRKFLLKVIFFLLLLGMFSIIIGAIVGLKTNFDVTVLYVDWYTILYHFIINGFLQITFYILSVFIISWGKREASYGLILISIFMVLMLPGINQQGVIPVGLNSLVNLLEHSPYRITLVLLIANIMIYLLIKYLFTKSFKN
ncbi:hypothetical protein CHH58_13355 [Terribacillus saccharophilus]|uniref:hypothetical protein n=1 Tax=Terribacillus saccharophilus TaxID=361277 RepID=UPI000BA57BC4|nr:hypothetical protein [Terribacillus saccharophilus]PAF36233.1 hypothetical protein CHH58_13355 [Terribacillus saccharophilus]